MTEAAIITIGSELVEGLRTDTNGPEIARVLSRLGYKVRNITSVADSAEDIESSISHLCGMYPLVITTGGLGPTHDDVTRQCAASALKLGISEDANLHKGLSKYAERYSTSVISCEIYKQAQVIHGATVLPAIAGTAPGQDIPTPLGHLIVLPGPPGECMPILLEWAGTQETHTPDNIDISCFGITESEIQHRVQDAIDSYKPIEFTVLASPKEAHVILTEDGCGPERFQEAVAAVRTALYPYAFADDGSTLAEVVLRLAGHKGLTISTAESCTGGLIAGALTDVPGSSNVVLGGVVSYANGIKERVLKVSRDDLETVGAVSSQVAAQMAEGSRKLLCSDLAVSVTGIAGPGGGSDDKPVGTVWFGISTADGTRTVVTHREGTRAAIRARTTSTALELLRRTLLGLPLEGVNGSRSQEIPI